MSGYDVSARLRELRAGFDASFTRPEATAEGRFAQFLRLRAGTHPCAVRLGDVAWVGRASRITPVPTRVPSFLGVVGLRGRLHAVYSLAALLGHPPAEAKWLLSLAEWDVTLACEEFLGYLRAPLETIVSRDADADVDSGATLFVDGTPWPILDVAKLTTLLMQLAPRTETTK